MGRKASLLAGATAPDQPPDDFDYKHVWPTRWITKLVAYPDEARYWTVHDTLEWAEGHPKTRSGYPYVIEMYQWRDRERVAHMTRTPPVWVHEQWWNDRYVTHRDHYVAVSDTDRNLLSYVQDERKGARNIRTPVKPGRYLSKYFSDVLTEAQILFYSRWQQTGVQPSPYDEESLYPIGFATTPDEITAAYRRGPSSCMSHAAGRSEGHFVHSQQHPVSIYGAGDLAVAFMASASMAPAKTKGGSPMPAKVIARCLCWPEKKAFGRVYPTPYAHVADGYATQAQSQMVYDAFFNRMKKLGYKHIQETHNIFDGARMLRVEVEANNTDYLLMPYLDNDYRVDDMGDHLVMKADGEYGAQTTSGLMNTSESGRDLDDDDDRETCDSCNDFFDAGDMNTVYRRWTEGRGAFARSSYCDDCRSEYTFHCDATNQRYVSGDMDSVEMEDGRTVCREWADEHAYEDVITEDWHENGYQVELENDMGSMHADTFDMWGFRCVVTGNPYHVDDMSYGQFCISTSALEDDVVRYLADEADAKAREAYLAQHARARDDFIAAAEACMAQNSGTATRDQLARYRLGVANLPTTQPAPVQAEDEEEEMEATS